MTDLLDKFQPVELALNDLDAHVRPNPLGVRMEEILSPTLARIEGRECILLGTNNYLGLTFERTALDAAHEAIEKGGTGTTGSRVANGSYAGHQDLERDIADFFGQPYAMVFTTGYQANLGIISALAGRDDTVLIDADSHASIYDACKLGDASIMRFKHNDAGDLEKRLARLPHGSNKLVILEGIYSMLGDCAPLAELVAAARRNNAYILLDEAHSFGVLGAKGRGLAEQEGLENEIDFILGTFSKSLGTVGGFCVSPHRQLEYLRYAARSYMFTASPPPAVVAAAAANLRFIAENPQLRTVLWANTDILYDGLHKMGYELGPEKTPVIGVQMPDNETGIAVWQTLFAHGVYVNLALPPATPRGKCLLRCSVCAAHTQDQLIETLKAFEAALPAFRQGRDSLQAA